MVTDGEDPAGGTFNIVNGADRLSSDCCREGHAVLPNIDSLVLACDTTEVYTYTAAVPEDIDNGISAVLESCSSVTDVLSHDGL